MSKVCEVTGKKPMFGHNVSHAHNKTPKKFDVNIHKKRFWVPSEGRFITLKVSAKGMKIIDKKGIETVLREIKERKRLQGN